MCQGLTSCGDNQFCDEQLRCDNRGTITSLNTSLVQHSYCKYTTEEGDKAYNRIDRSDENIANTINIKESPMIDYSYLTPCTDDVYGPGVACYVTTELSGCTSAAFWCRSDYQSSCVTSQSGNKTARDDSTLCSNHTFWQNVGTDYYSFGEKEGSGVRCNGRMTQTIYPWYRFYNGEPNFIFLQRCDDKSDQVLFVAEKPCPNRTYYIGVHNSEWCNTTSPAFYDLICQNPSKWLETTFIDQAMLDDPHNCQASCAAPGLNCIACTNKDYFPCPGSNTCIHTSLKCDGHPQCPGYEDEDFEMCKQIYFDKKVVNHFATYKCNSTMYPKVLTIVTACNGITECLDGKDEEFCNTDSVTTPILVAALLLVLGLFFVLIVSHYVKFNQNNNNGGGQLESRFEELIQRRKENSKDQENNRKISTFLLHILNTKETKFIKDCFNKLYNNLETTGQLDSRFEELIQRLKENPGDQENNRKISTFLLYILNTSETKFIRDCFIKFYNNLETTFENEDEEIFRYLKKNIHPNVTKDIVKHKFRGLVTKINEFIEKHIRAVSPFIEFQDKVTATPSLRIALSTIGALFSILSHFADIVKDTSLCISLLIITGGPAAVAEFPYNFSSAIVLSWMMTVIIPIFVSSVNLGLTKPFLVFTSARLKAIRGGQALAALGCLILAPLNTVILMTNLETTQHQAVEAARALSTDTLALYNQCDEIEATLHEYMQIEFGEEKDLTLRGFIALHVHINFLEFRIIFSKVTRGYLILDLGLSLWS